MKKNAYSHLMKQHGGSIPFDVLAKEQRKNRQSKKSKKSKKSDKSKLKRKTNRYKKKRINRTRVLKKSKSSKNKRKKSNQRTKKTLKKGSLLKYKNKCECNMKGDNLVNPNALGYCSNCIPEGVMIKGKDGEIYRNKKKHWLKID